MRLTLAFLLTFFSLFVVAEPQAEQSTEQADVATPYITMETTMGDIILELNPSKAPITVANFLEYAQDGYYDGTLFHRVIPDFMIQAGGFFTPSMIRKATKEPIKNEADNGLFNNRGTIAMARTAAVDSATSQFFINVKNNHFLNHGFRDFGYAVFGKVIAGMEVVDAIGMVETTRKSGHQNVPVEPVTIERVTVSYDKPKLNQKAQ